MKKNKNIRKIKNNKYHGYQEWYNIYGQLRLRCFMRNDLEVGYEELALIKVTNFYIK
jgi:hypothetical protein